jgi:hypothetical protein
MNFNEAMARRRTKENGCEPCYLSNEHARVLALEWRTGKRRILSWSRFNEAALEDGDLLLSFVGREVVIHGLNLGELADAIEESRLAKIWEQRAEYRPPVDAGCACVSTIEIRDSNFEDDGMLPGFEKGAGPKAIRQKCDPSE